MSVLAFWLSQFVGARFARVAAWAIVIAAGIAILGVAKCTYDGRVVEKHDAKVTGKTLTTDAAAKDVAAEQRARDTIAADTAEKERNDAIDQAPAGRPSDAAVRLGCRRLRQAGQDTSRIAECR